jgi:predicted transcriptional regulator
MTSPETTLLLVAVPLGGPEDAEGWRSIHQRVDCWAPATVRNHLNQLARQGLVKRRTKPTKTGFQWLYWRELERAAA